MGIEVTTCSSIDEMKAALAPILHYFGGVFRDEDMGRWSRNIDISRMHAARENGAVVGGAGAFTFQMTTPGGGSVPAAGITVVGVLPTHRRRGILTAMMRAQLDDVRRRGEPVAYLWASEETIYGRFGYGMASLCGDIEVSKTVNAFARPFASRAEKRIVGEEEAYGLFAPIYDRIRPRFPGMFARTEDWWRLRRLTDPEHRRAGGGVLNRVLVTLDGKPEAYALYRLHQTIEQGFSTGFLNVIEAIGATPEATREVWRFLFDVDWIGRVKASLLPPDHPLFFLLARPRALRYHALDALWVRLVDIPRALAARAIAPGEPVIIEVADNFCTWNAGCYRVAAGDVARTEAAADLALDITALGSVYLGGFTFAQLGAAGRIEERRAGALARADALFPRDATPWCPEVF